MNHSRCEIPSRMVQKCSKNAAQIEFQCSLVKFEHSSKTALSEILQPKRSASKPQFTSRSSEMPACILSTTHPSSKNSKFRKRNQIQYTNTLSQCPPRDTHSQNISSVGPATNDRVLLAPHKDRCFVEPCSANCW